VSAWENYRLEYAQYPNAGAVTLNANPYFEAPTNTTGWLGVNGATIDASSAQAHQGSQSMRITPDGITAVPQALSERIAVVAGTPITLHGWVRAAAGGDTIVLAVFWFDPSDVFVSASQISNTPGVGVWTEYASTTFTAPVTGFMRAVTNNPGTPAASHTWRVDEFTLTAQASDLPPVWIDLTSRVRGIIINGGEPDVGSAAGTARPATLTATLENIDHALTFGNTTSTLANWKPGRRIRCYEVIGNRRFDWFTGPLQAPETDDWAEQGVDQVVTISAVDRLGRLATGRTMVSTLAEHILYNAGAALRAYYPLGDTDGTYRPIVGADTYPPLTETVQVTTGADPTQNRFRRAAAAIGADDLPVPMFAPQYQSGTPAIAIAETELTATFGAGILTTGNVVTVAFWVNPTALEDPQWRPVQIGFGTGGAGGYIRIRRTDNSETPLGVWKATFTDDLAAAWTATAYGSHTDTGAILLACRINLVGNSMSLFVNNNQYPATVTGTMPSSMLLLSAIVGDNYEGGLGHLQIYDSDYTFTTHQAQYAMGVGCLAGQATGERIKTVAQYAGIPTSELGMVDTGTSTMWRATLAGQTPLGAMADAEATEQVRLRANGQGLLVFDSRTRRYNS
jgi:hypothetical protein